MKENQFTPVSLCASAVRLIAQQHPGSNLARVLRVTPDALLRSLTILMPSLIFAARTSNNNDAA
jgi:hypothetical protein